MSPVRALVAVLAAALNVTVPVPVPLAPPVTVSQLLALLNAVHEHPLVVVTVKEPVPPAFVNDLEAGVIAYAHEAAAA